MLRTSVLLLLATAWFPLACVGSLGAGTDAGDLRGTDAGERPGSDAADLPATDQGVDMSLCIESPTLGPPDPPIVTCNFMDWSLSADGHYLISQFGTTNDSTTLGGTTSCGWLQAHYNAYGCRYSAVSGTCLQMEHDIPWVNGHVDWDYTTVLDTVDAYIGPRTLGRGADRLRAWRGRAQ